MAKLRHNIDCMNPLYFDIETIPNVIWSVNCLPMAPMGNAKLPETVKKKQEEWAASPEGMIKKMSCDFRMNQIVAIEACGKDGNFLWNSNGYSEQKMLEVFWEHASQYEVLAGFGISHFDIPTIIQRSLHHKIIPTKDLSVFGYRKRYPVYDAQDILSKDGHPETGIDLNWYLEAYGLPLKTRKGSEVYGLWQKDKLEEISAYCKQDVLCEKALVEHIFSWYPAYSPINKLH